MFSDVILKALHSTCGYQEARSLVLGLSGGADSLSLAHCLHQAGIPIIAAHLDHGLRPSSAEEAEKVQMLAQQWGLPCVVERVDVAALAQERRIGIEEAARLCRYAFLFRLASQEGAQAVVVAHNADDQVETVLMHFLRGTGINGLKGMLPVSYLSQVEPDIPIFRPMLGVSRAEILAYCAEHQLPFITDESNLQPAYFRNRLRLEVIPMLEAVCPAFRQVTARNARALQADYALLERLEAEAFAHCLSRQESDLLALNRASFLSLDLALQRRVILRAVQTLLLELRDVGLARLERVIAEILAEESRITFAADLSIWQDETSIQFLSTGREPDFPRLPQLDIASGFSMVFGEERSLKHGWTLRAELISARQYQKLGQAEREDAFEAWLNPADVELPLRVRGANIGERWAPLGMKGKHQKLSDFFINNKIPQGARSLWPLVLSGGSLLWVCGLRIAQPWRLFGDEAQVLHLKLKPPADD